MKELDIKQIAKKITFEQLKDLAYEFLRVEEKWNSIEPGLFFIREGGYNDWFMHEIKHVYSDQRKIVTYDHSQKGKEVELHYVPDITGTTEQEALDNYAKQNKHKRSIF